MAVNADNGYTAYPVFKGLQKPLEFMGIRGRYIYWAAGTAGGAIVGFIIGYCVLGFLIGLVLLAMVDSMGPGFIIGKAREGLHTKETEKGKFIYTSSKKF